MKFLAIGECMVELSPGGEATYRAGFAGDTLNTAWYVRKCLPPDWSVAYFTAVGEDRMSDKMLAFLRASGIDTDLIVRRSDKTVGLYMIHLDKGERSFTYWRSDSAARSLARVRSDLDAALSGVDVAYVSGITLAILPASDRQVLFGALSQAREAGTKIAFDPNLRPRLWSDADTMRQSVIAFSRICDVVLPSFDDERTVFGDADPAATIARYRSAGADLVVVKNGSADVQCGNADGTWSYPVDPVSRIVDTTAAGDSFNAGFLARYLVEGTLETAVRSGAAVAGQVIGHHGALVEVVAPN